MTDKITDGIFNGSGPFAIPLLARFVSLTLPDHLEFAVAQCRFEDGAEVHVPIAPRTVAPLIQALSLYRMKMAEKEATNQTRH